jgi:hypothetical protein
MGWLNLEGFGDKNKKEKKYRNFRARKSWD